MAVCWAPTESCLTTAIGNTVASWTKGATNRGEEFDALTARVAGLRIDDDEVVAAEPRKPVRSFLDADDVAIIVGAEALNPLMAPLVGPGFVKHFDLNGDKRIDRAEWIADGDRSRLVQPAAPAAGGVAVRGRQSRR